MFFTLNPADKRHPFVFFFAADAFTSWQPLTSDAALQSALERVNLAHRVAADPVAVASAFHHHVEMFLAKVLDVSRTPSIDGVASRLGAGIFGPIAAFYGVTEPQLRGSLHVHLLLRLYAFTTPAAFLASVQQSLPDLCEALLSWTASVLATSLESLPRILRVPTVASTFSHLQPLPFSRRHRDVLGQQLGTSWDFDVAASHWSLASTSPSPASDPWFDPFHDAAAGRPSFLPWPREYLLDATSSPDQWALHLLYDLRHSAAASCLHDCRPKTCHKGTLGRLGFCRLGYWHWRGRICLDIARDVATLPWFPFVSIGYDWQHSSARRPVSYSAAPPLPHSLQLCSVGHGQMQP